MSETLDTSGRDRIILGVASLLVALVIGSFVIQKRTSSKPLMHSEFSTAVFSACNAVRRMEMYPGPATKSEADESIAKIESLVKTPNEREIADNVVYVLKGYQDAIQAFKKNPTDGNKNMLERLEHSVEEIRDASRPQSD